MKFAISYALSVSILAFAFCGCSAGAADPDPSSGSASEDVAGSSEALDSCAAICRDESDPYSSINCDCCRRHLKHCYQ